MSMWGCLRYGTALGLGAVALASSGCGSQQMVAPAEPTAVSRSLAPLIDGNNGEGGIDLRTLEAQDLLRIREEHAQMIASIPTATPVPTEPPASVASRYLMDGERSDGDGQSLVTDPKLGIWWYRDAGGDWTGRRLRERNPYGRLFYAPEFDNEHDTFINGGFQDTIGQMLVQEAVSLLPELEDRGSALIAPVTERLGWELASDEVPVMRIWSRFSYLGPEDFEPREYRIGGVLSFGVSDRTESGTGDVLYQYAVIGDWVGPVLLQQVEQ